MTVDAVGEWTILTIVWFGFGFGLWTGTGRFSRITERQASSQAVLVTA